jgi:predicted DNA-binding transcriptional regulator YafY
MVSWLLGFGGKVKVIEPDYIATEIQTVAENILSRYK